MNKKQKAMLLATTLLVSGVQAEIFGTGSNLFSITFADVGYTGNAGDPTNTVNGINPGSVGYSYRMGTCEVTVDQFAKARAADSRIGNGNEGYWNDGIRTVGSGAPASLSSWFEAARFANWLTSGDAYAGAYQFDTNGALIAVDRNTARISYGTVYVLPSEGEWYKAAYYKSVNDGSYSIFSSGLDAIPVKGTTNGWNYSNHSSTNYMWETGFGGMEQNGTYDMGGNVWEWSESAGDGILDLLTEGRVIRGGSSDWDDGSRTLKSTFRHDPYNPTNEHILVGFRVAAIPAFWLDVAVNGSGTVNIVEGWQPAGTNLATVATPDTGWLFMGWSEDLSGDYTTASTNLVMDTDKSITALFSDDADADGLLNSQETALETDPRNSDSDGDTLPDGWEVANGLNPVFDDSALDSDSDGLSNLLEYEMGTDPLDADTDSDALPDGWEVSFVLDPLSTNALADADSDSRADLYEFALGGDPTNGADIGWIPDFVVVPLGGTNWLDFIHARRTNATALGLSYYLELTDDPVSGNWTNGGYSIIGTVGLGGGFEAVTNRMDEPVATNLHIRLAIASSNAVVYSGITEITPLDVWAGGHGLSGTNAVPTADPDADGLSNAVEFSAGTDPANADTDADGLTDGEELNTHGTDPLNADTDADSFDDGLEVANGGDPSLSDLWRIDYIRSHGGDYDLYSSNSVLDISIGQAGFEVTNGLAWLSLQLEESTDLITWTNAGDEVIWSIPVDLSNAFYRVRSGR